MQLIQEIPDGFWGLFRSNNRPLYMEALLKIWEEYQYNNYFLSWEVCVQILNNYFSARRLAMQQEEQESEADVLEPPATRVLKWLVQAGWLKRLEDYGEGVTNLIIPDYSAAFLETFEKVMGEQGEETEIYIQNIYAILFSYRNDMRGDIRLLHTALVNTKELNRVLQNMLHNMDKFFGSLLNQEFYGDLLKEHLDGYVEEIVHKKYHILKTSDNFYQYKSDIKRWLKEIREEENRKLFDLEQVQDERLDMGAKTAGAADTGKRAAARSMQESRTAAETAAEIERGFRDMERRITNMDREHMRYVRATVTRLNYLLNGDHDRKGLLVKLLQEMGGTADGQSAEQKIRLAGERMNFSQFCILSEKSLYKKRKSRTEFAGSLLSDEEPEELDRSAIMKINRIQNRYSRKQIEAFIEEHMQQGRFEVLEGAVRSTEDFEKLILAYDDSTRKDSKFMVVTEEEAGPASQMDMAREDFIENGRFRYPRLTFVRRTQRGAL